MPKAQSKDRRQDHVTLQDVRIVFKNFAGKAGQYNREGDRNFAVLLDPDLAEAMKANDWNVKYLKPREEGDEPQAYLQVAVEFEKGRPPRIIMITSRGRTILDEDSCEVLDWAYIKNVDMIISPYNWEVNGNKGVKAYLQSIYVTIEEDELERKYADIDDVPSRSGQVDD